MRRSLIDCVRGLLVTVVLLVTADPVQAQPAAPPSTSNAAAPVDLAAAIRAEKDHFVAPSEAELAQAKAAVAAAIEPVLAYLATQPDGRSSGEALKLDVLQAQLQAAEPDPAQLVAVQRALQHNRPRLQHDAYYRLRAAVNRYVPLVRAAREEGVRNELNHQLEKLAIAWEEYAASGSHEAFDQVREAYTWLARRGQAKSVRQQLERTASQPNQVLKLSGTFLNEAVAGREITRPVTNTSTSDGARVNVQGTLRGRVTTAPQPNELAARLQVNFQGRVTSNINVSKGPVAVCAHGCTSVKLAIDVDLSERGARIANSNVRVRNNVNPYAANLQVRSRVLRRIANPLILRIAQKQRGKAGRDADRTVTRQLEDEIGKQAQVVARESSRYIDQLAPPVLLETERPATHQVRTTRTHLEWRARYAAPWQLGAPTSAPAPTATAGGVLIQVHESAANNSNWQLAGLRVNEADFRELVFETVGLVPAGDDDILARIPAVLVLADEDPFTIRFDQGQIFVTLRLQGFESDEDFYGGQSTVHTAYKPIVTSQSFALERTAPIEVEPAEAPETDRLRSELEYFFVERATRGGPSLEDLAQFPELHVSQLSLEQGWLTLALERGPWPQESASGGPAVAAR